MKRLIVCCDGTWGKLSNPAPTNVIKIARAFRPQVQEPINGIPSTINQIVYYDEGIGSNSVFDRLPGGVFGVGLGRDIRDAYSFLSSNYLPGDEIYLFGFSRGAYIVRCLAQMIGDYGILQRKHFRFIPQVYWLYSQRDSHNISQDGIKSILRCNTNPFYYLFRRQTQFQPHQVNSFLHHWRSEILPQLTHGDGMVAVLGCFDTVGQVGIPDVVDFLPLDANAGKLGRELSGLLTGKLGFHDYVVNPKVKKARHAAAIDEPRRYLRNTPMEKPEGSPVDLKQVWFMGDHGSVGGGSYEQQNYQLANIPLHWMLDEIDPDQIQVDREKLHEPHIFPGDNRMDPLNPLPKTPWWFRGGPLSFHRTIPPQGISYDPGSSAINQIHSSVLERLNQDQTYRPQNLRSFFP